MEEEIISGLSYKDAGVDIDAGAALVEAIKPLARATARPGATTELGGFGGVFDLKAAGFADPVLLAATDGVGTKLSIAVITGQLETVGIDLVAMCVNDLVVQGAEPLFFLDYLAVSRLDVVAAKTVVAGIAEGCKQAGCALIGGETAEMPGLYRKGDFDLAGFAVGAVERDRMLTGQAIAAGDVVLGLASSGLHSNGFTLVRRIVDDGDLDYEEAAPFSVGHGAAERILADALLEPTRIYVKSCLAAIAAGGVRGLAHITGGGLTDNIPRVLPDGLGVRLDAARWPVPLVFGWLAAAGGIAVSEMARTFNMGIGMVAIVEKDKAETVKAAFTEAGETVHDIGEVVERSDGAVVAIDGCEEQWRS